MKTTNLLLTLTLTFLISACSDTSSTPDELLSHGTGAQWRKATDDERQAVSLLAVERMNNNGLLKQEFQELLNGENKEAAHWLLAAEMREGLDATFSPSEQHSGEDYLAEQKIHDIAVFLAIGGGWSDDTSD